MTFERCTISAIALACVILQACCTHELNQMGVKGSFESAPTSFLPPPVHYLHPKAKRRVTVITKKGKRYSFFAPVSALSALIPLEPDAAYPAPATPAPATPAVTNFADSKATDTRFVLLYRPIASQPKIHKSSAATFNTAPDQHLLPYVISATIQLPTLQASNTISPPGAWPPIQSPQSSLALKASAPQVTDAIDTPLTLAEVKELALETLKHPTKIWNYLKYTFQTRGTTTTTQKPVDAASGYAVLALPKSSTPATSWKKATSLYDKASMRKISLSGDPLYSYRPKPFADQHDSSEDFMT